MPNGGFHHCGHCRHYDQSERRCELRGVRIEISHWTTCVNFNQEGILPTGPVLAIVGEVRSGAISYCQIPYLDGRRADTVQKAGGGDTVVKVRDSIGNDLEFPSVEEYMRFYNSHPRHRY